MKKGVNTRNCGSDVVDKSTLDVLIFFSYTVKDNIENLKIKSNKTTRITPLGVTFNHSLNLFVRDEKRDEVGQLSHHVS